MSHPPAYRPIRFRLWDSESKVMIPWEHACFTMTSLVTRHGGPDPLIDGRVFPLLAVALQSRDVRVFIPSQYTGFDDDAGTPIYEGDLVEGHTLGGGTDTPDECYLHVIRWDSDGGRWVAHVPVSSEDLPLHDARLNHVVGNVWEHPHLLPGDEEDAP